MNDKNKLLLQFTIFFALLFFAGANFAFGLNSNVETYYESPLGGSLNTAIGTHIMSESKYMEINGDYYYANETIAFSSGATIDTGLTAANQDEDFGDDIYLLLQKNSIIYNFTLTTPLESGDYLSDATEDDYATLTFLGEELRITGATSDTITVELGTQVYLEHNQTITIDGRETTLIAVGDTSAVVSVEGTFSTISIGNTKTVNGVRIKVIDTFNDIGEENDAASLLISDDGGDAEKTYTDGDAYIGENENDPVWVWNLANLNTATPTIGISYDQTIDNPADGPASLGNGLTLPNDYFTISLDSLNQENYRTYTVSTKHNYALYNGSSLLSSNANVLLFQAAGENDSFILGTNESDEIAVWYNLSNNSLQYFYKDHSDSNKFKLVSASTHDINASKANVFTLQYANSAVTVNANAISGLGVNFTLDLATDVGIFVELNGSSINYLGHSNESNITVGDITYGSKDISAWNENTRTKDGLILQAYGTSSSADEFIFELPEDYSDFKVNIKVNELDNVAPTATDESPTGPVYSEENIYVTLADAKSGINEDSIRVSLEDNSSTYLLQNVGTDSNYVSFNPGTGRLTINPNAGKIYESPIGYNLNSVIGTQNLSNDLHLGIQGDTYDAHETVSFTSGATIDTGLTATNQNEDFDNEIYLLLQKSSIAYNYILDEPLGSGEYLTDTTEEDYATLTFLGEELRVTGATSNAITVELGARVYLEINQTFTCNNKEITLLSVNQEENSTLISVDNTSKTINEGSTTTVNGTKIKVRDIFYDSETENSTVSILIACNGGDVERTYEDGDEYIGENVDDPDWVWNFANLNTATPTIEIDYDQVIDHSSDSPVTIGNSLTLPNDYFYIKLDSINQDNYSTYNITTFSSLELCNAQGNIIVPSGKVLYFYTSGGTGKGFEIRHKQSDYIVAYYNASTDLVEFYYYNSLNNKFKQTPTLVTLNMSNDKNDIFKITYENSEINVDWNASTQSFIFGNISLYIETSGSGASEALTYIGHSNSSTSTAGDVRYIYGNKAHDISTWTQDTRTQDGIIIHPYANTSTFDHLKFEVPLNTNNFKVNLEIPGPRLIYNESYLEKSVSIYVEDNSGNGLTDSWYFLYDRVSPTITIYSPTETNYYVGQIIPANFSFSDNVGVETGGCSIGAPLTIANGNINLTGVSAGEYTLNCSAYDAVGLYRFTNISFNVTAINQSTQAIINSTSYVINSSELNELILPNSIALNKIILGNELPDDKEIILSLAQLMYDYGTIYLPAGFSIIKNDSTYGNISFVFKSNTTIIAANNSVDWNGLMSLPYLKNTANYAVSSGTVNEVIYIGSNLTGINFSQPVQIILTGVGTDKQAGWSDGESSLTKATTVCDDKDTPTNIPTGGLCYINSNGDLYIWTYHFTIFGIYTPITGGGGNNGGHSSGGSSGGGGIISTTNTTVTTVCSAWSACSNGTQKRTCTGIKVSTESRSCISIEVEQNTSNPAQTTDNSESDKSVTADTDVKSQTSTGKFLKNKNVITALIILVVLLILIVIIAKIPKDRKKPKKEIPKEPAQPDPKAQQREDELTNIKLKVRDDTSEPYWGEALTSQEEKAMNYIINMRKKGFDDKQIMTQLKIKGWKEEKLTKLFKR